MSALFRAELDNLQRLVAQAALERSASTNERERIRTHVQARVTQLQTTCRRIAKSNRATVLAAVGKLGRPAVPVSANKVAEYTGITDDTTRKHLRELADAGEIVAVASPSGKQIRYHMKREPQ